MADDPPLVPTVVCATVPTVAVGHELKTARPQGQARCRAIGIDAEGVTFRVGRGADTTMIAAIVHALKVGQRSAHPELCG